MQPTTFAELVRQTLDRHGLNPRSQRRRTKIDHVTLGDILDGTKPRMETVLKFARGFGLDANQCLVLAGHEPVLNHTHAFLDDIEAIRRESGVNFTVTADELLLVRESPDMLRQYAEAIRRRVTERQQQGA